MTPDYFDRLEAELRAAVPRAASDGIHHDAEKPPRLRVSRTLLALNAAALIAVAVVLIAVLDHRHAARPRPPVVPASRTTTAPNRAVVTSTSTGPSRPPIHPGIYRPPLGSVPTMPQLLANFAVLRRPQTAADKTLQASYNGGTIAQYDRYITTLPSGYKVYLYVDHSYSDSGTLNVVVVDPNLHTTSGAAFANGVDYTIDPISSGGNDAVWVSIVPDGVSSVIWQLSCSGTAAECAGVAPTSETVPVHDNVAVRQIPHAGNCQGCTYPRTTRWLGANGQPVMTFEGDGAVATPPFVEGAPVDRVHKILAPSGLGDARIGQSFASAVASLSHLLGQSAGNASDVGSCGISDEAAWASPTVNSLLTIFGKDGRFVGYRYTAGSQGVFVTLGPGASLTTAAGLTLTDTISDANRLYPVGALTTDGTNDGTFTITTADGTLTGTAQVRYPDRQVAPDSVIRTIAAGQVDCPSAP